MGLNGKESICNSGDTGESDSVSGFGRSPGEGNGNPPQYSCLENLMDRGAWGTTVHGIARDGHDLATKPPSQCYYANNSLIKNSAVMGLPWWSSG